MEPLAIALSLRPGVDAFSTLGAPPHAGLAFGLDRLCTIIGGKAASEAKS